MADIVEILRKAMPQLGAAAMQARAEQSLNYAYKLMTYGVMARRMEEVLARVPSGQGSLFLDVFQYVEAHGERQRERPKQLVADGVDVTLNGTAAGCLRDAAGMREGWQEVAFAVTELLDILQTRSAEKLVVLVGGEVMAVRMRGALAAAGLERLGVVEVMEWEGAGGPDHAGKEVVAVGVREGAWPAVEAAVWLHEGQLAELGVPTQRMREAYARNLLVRLAAAGRLVAVVGDAAFVTGVMPEKPAEKPAPVVTGNVGTAEALGRFVPHGSMWPARWSASLVEDLLACPYKAYGERILNLRTLDPLDPQPDPKAAGIMVHSWLEEVGREIAEVTADNAALVRQRLDEVAERLLAEAEPLLRAVWRGRLKKLSGALVDEWLARGRRVVLLEGKRERVLGAVTVTAKIDRVEEDAKGGRTVLDYKTGTPPSMNKVCDGSKPQLAIEAWLLGADMPVSQVEYWRLKGYGRDLLPLSERGVDEVTAPVAEGLARLAAAFGEGAPFPAIPDPEGSGMLAVGHCERCGLAGVCRRQAAGPYEHPSVEDHAA